MIIAYHYHIPGIKRNGKILTSSQQGIFLDGLAIYFKKIICYLHYPNRADVGTMDYTIKNSNVELISLGAHDNVYKRLLFSFKYTRNINAKEFDLFLFRGPSPLIPFLLYNYRSIQSVLLIVGDYSRENALYKNINLKKIVVFIWSRIYKILQDHLMENQLVIFNNRWQYEEYIDKLKYIGLASTNMISKNDYFKRVDTCKRKIKNILFVGRIDENKGLVEIAEAIIILLKKGFKVRYSVAGYEKKTGNVLNHIMDLFYKNNFENNFIYHGHVIYGRELFTIYKNADIFVNASRSTEGFPRTIWESFAHCTPVITTSVGGIGYTIIDRRHALFCKPRSKESIASKIEEMIKNNSLRKNLIANGYRLALDNSFEMNIKKIYNLIFRHYRNSKQTSK